MLLSSLYRNRLFPLLAVRVLLFAATTTTTARAQITSLSAQEFYDLATTGQVDLIIDVRTQSEWDSGHIANATLVADMGPLLSDTPVDEINATLQELGIFPCLQCTTVVYCRSGARAGAALDLLYNKAGFMGATLYNGGGTSQWTNAGYPLVNTLSFEPPCMKRPPSSVTDRVLVCPRSVGDENNSPAPQTPTLMPVPAPTSSPMTTAPPQQGGGGELPQQKEAPPAKCGSLANERGRGGAAAAAKGCESRLRQRKLKGVFGATSPTTSS